MVGTQRGHQPPLPVHRPRQSLRVTDSLEAIGRVQRCSLQLGPVPIQLHHRARHYPIPIQHYRLGAGVSKLVDNVLKFFRRQRSAQRYLYARPRNFDQPVDGLNPVQVAGQALDVSCLLYTSDAADDLLCVDPGGRRIIKKQTGLKVALASWPNDAEASRWARGLKWG